MKLKILLLTALLITMVVQSQTVANNNLILHYSFNGSGVDSSSGKLDIKLNTESDKHLFGFVKGRNGIENTALEFYGNSTGLKPGLNISPKNYGELTITAWVWGQPYGYLIGTDLPNMTEKDMVSCRTLFFFDKGAAANYMYASNGKKRVSYIKSGKLKDNEWNFIAVTFRAADSSIILYVNDEFYIPRDIKKNKLNVFWEERNGDLILGNSKNKDFSNALFKGRVDDLRIYNKALTAEEITALSGIKTQDSLIGAERRSLMWQIFFIILFAFYLFAIGYMIYTFIKEKKLFYKVVSPQEAIDWEQEAKSLSIAKSSDNDAAYNYVNDAFETWKIVDRDANGLPLRSPVNKQQVVAMFEALQKAQELKPSDKNTVDWMNELGELTNSLSKRKFYGSIKLIVGALILPVLMYILSLNQPGSMQLIALFIMILPTIVYTMASYAPPFVINNRSVGSVSKIFGGIFGFVLGIGGAMAVAAANTPDTITKWSDGTTTRDSNAGAVVGGGLIALMIAVAALLVAVVLISVAAVITFLRNFVFYK